MFSPTRSALGTSGGGEVAKLVHRAKLISLVALFYNPAVYNMIDSYAGDSECVHRSTPLDVIAMI